MLIYLRLTNSVYFVEANGVLERNEGPSMVVAAKLGLGRKVILVIRYHLKNYEVNKYLNWLHILMFYTTPVFYLYGLDKKSFRKPPVTLNFGFRRLRPANKI